MLALHAGQLISNVEHSVFRCRFKASTVISVLPDLQPGLVQPLTWVWSKNLVSIKEKALRLIGSRLHLGHLDLPDSFQSEMHSVWNKEQH